MNELILHANFTQGWELIGLKLHAGFKCGLHDYVMLCFSSSEWPDCPHAGWQQWSY